jgi:uncharacterized membrane protein
MSGIQTTRGTRIGDFLGQVLYVQNNQVRVGARARLIDAAAFLGAMPKGQRRAMRKHLRASGFPGMAGTRVNG